MTVILRYYADAPPERFEYREITRIERFESTCAMGNVGKGAAIGAMVAALLVALAFGGL